MSISNPPSLSAPGPRAAHLAASPAGAPHRVAPHGLRRLPSGPNVHAQAAHHPLAGHVAAQPAEEGTHS